MTSLDKFFKKIYNIVLMAVCHDGRANIRKRMKTETNELAQHIGPPCHGVTLKAYCWSKEKAGQIFKKNLRHMKNTIEGKIDLYKPLKVETTYPEFLEWLQDGEFKIIRKIPAGCKVKTFLDDLIKNFLIERAYYALSEKYIRNRMMKKLDVSDPNDIRILEITDFIMKEIETDGLARLKKFEERAEFRYFLGMVVTRLWYDFLREHYQTKKHLTRFGPEFEALFDRPVDSPYDLMIKSEDEELKKEAVKILPQILENLTLEEKLAIKWKYENDLTISATARALGKTRYKTEKLIKQTEEKIKKKILLRIKDNVKVCIKENEKKATKRHNETQRKRFFFYNLLRAPSCNFVAKKP